MTIQKLTIRFACLGWDVDDVKVEVLLACKTDGESEELYKNYPLTHLEE